MAYGVGDKEKYNLFEFEDNLKEARHFKKKAIWPMKSERICL